METSTDYRRPYRPLPVSLFNRAGRIARRLGFSDRLDIGRMIAAARRRTGLSDFGDEWFLEPLEVLVRSINREARLTPLGMRIQRSRIVSALSTRLRVERLLRERPEILEADLGKVIVIAGLQRTATTTLHRLIAADPRVRALRSWESLSPVPLPGEGLPREQPPGETARGRRLPDGDEGRGGGPGRNAGGHPRRRIRDARRAARAIGYLAPDFLAIHPIEHDAPEEEIFLLDLSFMSQSWEAMMHVPGYSRWLESQDHAKCYRVHAHGAEDPAPAASGRRVGAQDPSSHGVSRCPPRCASRRVHRADAPRSEAVRRVVLQHGGPRARHPERPRRSRPRSARTGCARRAA